MSKGAQLGRIVKFGIVGFSGVFVNLLVSELFFRVVLLGVADETVRLAVSNANGVVVSIFTNFLLNDYWTWGDRNKGTRQDWFRRLAKYYVAASVAGVLQVAVAAVSFDFVFSELTFLHIGGYELDSTLSICAGIGAGMVINFLASHFWAFKDVEEAQ